MSELKKGAAASEGIWRPLKIKLINRLIMGVSLVGLGQWAFYGIFRCPFIVPYVQCQNCPVVTCHGRIFNLFWGFWGGLFLLTIVFGRAFCGWLCPGGTVNRILGSFSKVRLKPSNWPARILPWGKYLVLAGCFYLIFLVLQPRVNVPIRVGGFFLAVGQTFQFADRIWVARTLIVLGVFAVGLILPVAWCRFVCPTGGLLEALGRFSIFRVFKTSRCNNCDLCRRVCYVDTRPEETNCTNCGDCLPACPQKCIGIGRNPEA